MLSVFFLLQSLFAQEERIQGEASYPQPTSLSKEAKVEVEGFGAFKLGDSYEEIDKLFGNPPYQFLLRHEKDGVEASRSSIETYKNDFFDEFSLQFDRSGRLYFIRIQISSSYQNFNGLYDWLKKKYGMPQSLNFNVIKWTKEGKSIVFGRQGEIRYLDENLLNQAIGNLKGVVVENKVNKANSKKKKKAADKAKVEKNIHTYAEIMDLY